MLVTIQNQCFGIKYNVSFWLLSTSCHQVRVYLFLLQCTKFLTTCVQSKRFSEASSFHNAGHKLAGWISLKLCMNKQHFFTLFNSSRYPRCYVAMQCYVSKSSLHVIYIIGTHNDENRGWKINDIWRLNCCTLYIYCEFEVSFRFKT